MGTILAKFRKRETTVEILEGIEKEIERLVRLKRRNVELEKHYMGSLLLYSVIGYLVMALCFYFLYEAKTWQQRILQILPLLVFPVLIWLIRKALHWYFVKRMGKNDLALEELRNKKKNVLEDVKENESYKKAKEILEKFDPSATLPPPSMMQTPSPGPTPILRQRPQSARGRSRGRGSPTITTPRTMPRPGNQPMLQSPQAAMIRSPGTVRPILSQEQTTFDKLVGYLVGDGPATRYALICKHCYSHNGMALQEEFEFLAFRCAYCGTFNPSKKVRPNAPKLPQTPAITARPSFESPGSSTIESGSDSSESDQEPDQSDQTVGAATAAAAASNEQQTPGPETSDSKEAEVENLPTSTESQEEIKTKQAYQETEDNER